jgi:23S rRNA pseudouridine955/2504/2580 synthase
LSASLPENSNKPAVQILEVGERNDEQRLDNFLATRLKGVPKTLIYRIIRKGEVRINGKRAKPEQKLEVGDKVRVPPLRLASTSEAPRPGARLEALLRQSVLFEDEDLIVLNKPAGLPVHGGTGVKLGLIEAMRALYPDVPGMELVHRLDRGTSGCLLLAKTGRARRGLTEAFRDHQVLKIYHALVVGEWPKQVTTVDANLQRQPERGGERRVTVDVDGKEARTGFRILKRLGAATLVEARPLTGRTHQIRVHAALVGCPLVGDDKYNSEASNAAFAQRGIRRLCLHAAEVRFPHPRDGRVIHIKADYDAAFAQALQQSD